MEEAEPSDTNKLKAAQLLGQSAGLFQTEINLTDQRRDSEGLASEIEALLLTANESAEVEQETPEQLH